MKEVILVRHLKDLNALRSYKLDGPLIIGQEGSLTSSVDIIKQSFSKGDYKSLKIIYPNSKRTKETAYLIHNLLKDEVSKIEINESDIIDIFKQGDFNLPDYYKDGDHFKPLSDAWDAYSDEVFKYKNIDYRFGSPNGYKEYPSLKCFFRYGDNLVDSMIKHYSFLEFLLHDRNEESLRVFIVQSGLPLIMMELEYLITNNLIDKIIPNELHFYLWSTYKNNIESFFGGDIPMGYTKCFELKKFKNDTVENVIRTSKKYLENRKLTSQSSIQGIINGISNDFSELNVEFKKETRVDIDSIEIVGNNFGFYPISVVIPYYNSRSTILDVLRSIELQNLTKKEMSNVEVVIVNDGWKDDLEDIVIPSDYSFELKIVTCKKNGGRSVARNIGARNAKHDILIFLDADNLVSGECLREHSIRNKIAPDQLYTSLVANIFLEDVPKITRPYFLENKPLPKPNDFNEFRVKEEIKSSSVGIHKIKKDTTIEILKETNNFRNYGFGRMVAYYDLPSMYATYCVSVTKTMFQKIGGFSEKFKGWGMEDSFFGAIGIVRGAKIIPILSCGSYSVNLPSHSGSEEKEKMELKVNVDRYNKLMRDSFGDFQNGGKWL
jgi:GT2 family glycosyltransferase